MGIGLNSGPFMSGNVGSQRRLEYTAIGDMINAASRIEGMTKGTPYALYLAESTKEALSVPADDLVYIDEMPVRGRTHPIKLWSLTGEYVQKQDWESEVAKAAPPRPRRPPPAELRRSRFPPRTRGRGRSSRTRHDRRRARERRERGMRARHDVARRHDDPRGEIGCELLQRDRGVEAPAAFVWALPDLLAAGQDLDGASGDALPGEREPARTFERFEPAAFAASVSCCGVPCSASASAAPAGFGCACRASRALPSGARRAFPTGR